MTRPAAGDAGFFLLGALSLTAQTVLVREALFAFHGGEIGLGLFFAVWLAAIAAGAAWGARRAPRFEAPDERARSGFALGLALLPHLAWMQIALWRFHRAFLPVDAGGFLPAGEYLLLLLPAVAPLAVATGLLFPLGLAAWGLPAGRAYAAESVGAMAGAAATTLWALPRLPHAAAVLAAAPLLLAWQLLVSRRPLPALLTLGSVLLLVTGLAGDIDAWTAAQRWRWLGTGAHLRGVVETPYHQAAVAEIGGEASLYLDGLYQGGLCDPFTDSLEAAVVLTQHPAPRRVLVFTPGVCGPARVIAGARGTAVCLARAHDGVDRAIAAAGACPAEAEIAVEVLTLDPRRVVHVSRERFDLIAVLHGGADTGSGNRLYTREFFGACARLLDPGGVLVVSLPGTANVAAPESRELRAGVHAALQDAFAEVRLAPGATWHFFAAGEGGSPMTWAPDSLAARRARLWPSGRPWPAGILAQQFPPDRVRGLARDLQRERAPANSDVRPSAYYQQLRRWDRFSGSGLAGPLEAWHRAPWIWSVGLLAALVALGWVCRRRWGQPFVSLASTGAAGMGTSLLLLLLFQTCLGTLYLKVGLMHALFMAGLGAGAWLAARSAASPDRALLVLDGAWTAALALLAATSAAIARAAPQVQEPLLLALAAGAGVLTGLPFPPAAAALQAHGRPPAVAGAIADAGDHAGAVAGALLLGTLLVPLLGFAGALLVLAALKGASLFGALVGPRR